MGVCTKWRDPIVHSETVCLSAGFCIWRVATSFIQPHCEYLVKWMWLKWSSVKWMDPTRLVSFPNAVYDHIYGQQKMQPINFWLSVFAQGYIYIHHLYIYIYVYTPIFAVICSTIPTAHGSGVSEEDQDLKTHHLQVHLQKNKRVWTRCCITLFQE